MVPRYHVRSAGKESNLPDKSVGTTYRSLATWWLNWFLGVRGEPHRKIYPTVGLTLLQRWIISRSHERVKTGSRLSEERTRTNTNERTCFGEHVANTNASSDMHRWNPVLFGMSKEKNSSRLFTFVFNIRSWSSVLARIRPDPPLCGENRFAPHRWSANAAFCLISANARRCSKSSHENTGLIYVLALREYFKYIPISSTFLEARIAPLISLGRHCSYSICR